MTSWIPKGQKKNQKETRKYFELYDDNIKSERMKSEEKDGMGKDEVLPSFNKW